MSLATWSPCVREGDTFMVYAGPHSLLAVRAKQGLCTQTKYGAIRHSELLGRPFGSRFTCSKGGYVWILHPTPELWTRTLAHRTQILYAPDIAMVITMLDVRPGSVVCEAGTGSGSLSHAFLRAVAPSGHLHTVEFHAKRAAQAREEFQQHGFGNVVTVRFQDVCLNGFGVEGSADAVCLDIPSPWNAVAHARTAMKRAGGRLCSFSPCIEQVQQTCQVLESNGFHEMNTLEVLLRPCDVRTISLQIPDIGCTTKRECVTDQGCTPTGVVDKEKGLFLFNTGCIPREVPGHTGYLTFASLPPARDF
uniref:tRNA (adenine(58)-N(1))-methyltransferase catalytic subunit TRMT61A n=1 Tax=Myxine glutinosa TaxID=7769 RepID=UPI0035901252